MEGGREIERDLCTAGENLVVTVFLNYPSFHVCFSAVEGGECFPERHDCLLLYALPAY